LIGNALRPAEVQEIALCFELSRATVVVVEDQLSLAIGKRGQNVRLAARLTGWDIDVLTPAEYQKGMEDLIQTLRVIEEIDDTLIDKIVAMGLVSLLDIEEVGSEPLVETLGLSEEMAAMIVEKTAEEAKRLATELEQSKATRAVLGTESEGEPVGAATEEATEATAEEASVAKETGTAEEAPAADVSQTPSVKNESVGATDDEAAAETTEEIETEQETQS